MALAAFLAAAAYLVIESFEDFVTFFVGAVFLSAGAFLATL
jgi:hypothetical protein